jgi:hypothetical protein
MKENSCHSAVDFRALVEDGRPETDHVARSSVSNQSLFLERTPETAGSDGASPSR